MADHASRSRGREGAIDPQAEAEVLRSRLREGEFDLLRLQLWSYFGHEAARIALDSEAMPRPGALLPWFVGLGRWGPAPIMSTMIAFAERALPLVLTSAPALHQEAQELVQGLGRASREELSWHRLSQLRVPFGLRVSELRRGADPRERSPQFSPLVIQRAAEVIGTLLSTEDLRKALDQLEWLGLAALAIPGWSDEVLLEEICQSVLPGL